MNKTKVAIPSSSNEENAKMYERFGRCNYFCLYDSENDVLEFLNNPATNARGGAGFQAVEFLINNEVNVVIVPRLGPNAEGVLKKANIEIYQGDNIPIKELIIKWKNNALSKL